jgi:colicin import membrane protein
LITIEQNDIFDMFTQPGLLDALLLKLQTNVLSMKSDVQTSEGRQEITSLGYNIARTKTYIDNIGKELTTEYKEVPKKIDAIRKNARDLLDNLKDEVKKPLDEWQKEQEKIAYQIDIDAKWDEAHAMHDTFIEAKKQQAQRIEIERLQREEDIRRQAIVEAELNAKIELEKQQKKHEREIALKEIERMEAVNAERQRAKEETLKATRQLERELNEGKLLKQSELQAKCLANEIELARKNNVQHQKNIQEDSIMSLILNVGIDSTLAQQIVEAIDQNLIDNIFIKY